MSIKRFFAKTTRDALRMVRDALGPDGAILSNRAVDGGIEILALGPNDVAALMPPSPEDEAKGASTSHSAARKNESYAAEPLNQVQVIVPSVGENFPERAVQTGAGFKASPRLHFPAFDGKQEQRIERWTIPDLSVRSHQTKNVTLQGEQGAHGAEAVPDSVNGVKKRRSAMPSRKKTSSAARVTRVAVVSAKKKQPGFDRRQVADEGAANVLNEIKLMRSTLEQQLSALNWNEQQRRDPARMRVLSQLLAAGFSASLAHDLLSRLPMGQSIGQPSAQPAGQEGQQEEKREREAMNWIKTVLAGNLQTIGNENEMLEKGGVYALVGPTGVGKTTTTAKLAARCVVRHGSDKLALLTTDGYRIGAHEQLRIYGKILGVTVYAVKDVQDLTLALAELRGKHMVLIDTVGMGQRDRMVAEQVAMLTGCGTEVKRLLLLNAASSGDTLNEVVHAYQGGGLAGAILTKLDEAVTTGCALDTAIRHQLPLYYVATGQRVPEDLHLANPGHLINSAFNNLPATSPFIVPEDVFPLLMTGYKSGATKLDIEGVYLG